MAEHIIGQTTENLVTTLVDANGLAIASNPVVLPDTPTESPANPPTESPEVSPDTPTVDSTDKINRISLVHSMVKAMQYFPGFRTKDVHEMASNSEITGMVLFISDYVRGKMDLAPFNRATFKQSPANLARAWTKAQELYAAGKRVDSKPIK